MQFDKKTIEKIIARDNEVCLFCTLYYNMPEEINDCLVFDIMHFIPKSQGGLGIEQNGVLGCRYHHHLLDNGNKGLRSEMLRIMEENLRSTYEDWGKENLVFNKANL